jgi:predicted transposase YbfD/YdcC
VRRGQVFKETDEVVFALTSLWPSEAPPERLQELIRDHWTIENGQHYRRDRTQDEDRCPVRETTSARNLSLFRSLAIFLLEAQRHRPGGKLSQPDFERQVSRHPRTLIRRFMGSPHPE